MENVFVNNCGIFLNAEDIKNIVESKLEWAEVKDGQIFCARNVMNEKTPIGTSIIVGVDGMRCKEGSNEIELLLSNGIYDIVVKTESENDEFNIRFNKTMPVPGTFGEMVDGELDILTEEEKEFKYSIEELLGDRTDEYAEMFRKDNTREIGGRGLILLEKVKTEIKNDDVLTENDITPAQLIATYIDMTERYVSAKNTVAALDEKHDELLERYRNTFEEGSRMTKKLAKDIEIVNKKIVANNQLMEYCAATIKAAVLPVLNMELER